MLSSKYTHTHTHTRADPFALPTPAPRMRGIFSTMVNAQPRPVHLFNPRSHHLPVQMAQLQAYLFREIRRDVRSYQTQPFAAHEIVVHRNRRIRCSSSRIHLVILSTRWNRRQRTSTNIECESVDNRVNRRLFWNQSTMLRHEIYAKIKMHRVFHSLHVAPYQLRVVARK